MTNFDKLTASPETLGAFLASIPTTCGPWDEAFRKEYCTSCSQENCEPTCPHQDKRGNPAWWLKQVAEGSKHGKGTVTVEDIITAGRKIFGLILTDQHMMGMNQRELNRTVDYVRIAINEIFTPETLQEVIGIGDQCIANATDHQTD